MISGTETSSEEKSKNSRQKKVKTLKTNPKRLGQLAVYRGGKCKTGQELVESYGFTKEQVEIYLKSYELTAIDYKSELGMRKVVLAGRKQGARGGKRPTEEMLVSMGYSLLEAKAYLKSFDLAFKNKDDGESTPKSPIKRKINHTSPVAEQEVTQPVETQLPEPKRVDSTFESELQEAKNAGRYLASFGRARPIFNVLKAQNEYTDMQAQAFLDAFDQYLIDKAASEGRVMAQSGGTKPSIDELKQQKAYSDEAAQAYLIAFDEVTAEIAKQSIQDAKKSGRNASLRNNARPTIDDLKVSNKYSDEQAMAYLEAFDALENTKKMTQAKMAGIDAAQSQEARPTLEQLKQLKAYSDEQAAIFYEGFDETIADIANKAIAKLRQKGRLQARTGTDRPTMEKLTHKYTHEEAVAYLEGYDSVAVADPIRKRKQIKKLGRGDAIIGIEKPTMDQLKKEKGYDDKEACTYLEGFLEGENEKLKIDLKNARKAGKDAAKRGCEKPTAEWLKNNKNYTNEEINTYLQAFDATQVNTDAIKLSNAKKAGSQAACMGLVKPTIEELTQKAYSNEEAFAYLKAFDAVEVTETAVSLRRARQAGYSAAYEGVAKPTAEELKHRKAYSEQEISAYFKGYDLVDIKKGKLNKAKKLARQAASHGIERPTAEMLKERGFTVEQVTAYFEAYDSSQPVTEAESLLKKAHNSGQRAAQKGKARPSIDELKEQNGYSEEQIEAYLKGYDAPKKKKRKQPTQPVEPVVATPTPLSVLAAVAPSPQILGHLIPTDTIMELDERPKTLLPAFALKKSHTPTGKTSFESSTVQEFSAPLPRG